MGWFSGVRAIDDLPCAHWDETEFNVLQLSHENAFSALLFRFIMVMQSISKSLMCRKMCNKKKNRKSDSKWKKLCIKFCIGKEDNKKIDSFHKFWSLILKSFKMFDVEFGHFSPKIRLETGNIVTSLYCNSQLKYGGWGGERGKSSLTFLLLYGTCILVVRELYDTHPPPASYIFYWRSWNNFYGHSLSSTDSRY